ncbi:ubiquitin fusion degradation protein [Ascosphaera acerosa]|nr:ubiquitin fusion degradation protein [Ascosphaera acerosa]
MMHSIYGSGGVGGARNRRFDEFYRCYPVAMLPGPERDNLNHGGKVIMPPSALDRLTRLHITYPMMFELVNGAQEKCTHAGVLEFIAEEGRIYLPQWIKSTDLPPGSFIKLQAQSPAFLDITDPKAVLEQSFRNFSCLTTGDVFTFSYNDVIYEMAVLETKPETQKNAVSVLETDLEVDFAAPVGYTEPTPASAAASSAAPGAASSSSSPSAAKVAATRGGLMHSKGSMAQAINYDAIAPATIAAAEQQSKSATMFAGTGHKLGASKKKTGVSDATAGAAAQGAALRGTPGLRLSGPQPLRLPPNKLFFGYEIKPMLGTEDADAALDEEQKRRAKFPGAGQTLRSATKKGKKAAGKS